MDLKNTRLTEFNGTNNLPQTSTDQVISKEEYFDLETRLKGIENTLKILSGNDTICSYSFTNPNGVIVAAGVKNNFYRGKFLGNSVTDEQYENIDNGTFKDIFLGDYWWADNVAWRIAAFDYWLNTGDTEENLCTKHHVLIVPDKSLGQFQMNSTDTTTGAYVGSDYYTGNNSNTARADATTKINGVFGAGHILTHREFLKNSVANNCENNGAWYDSTFELMTEQMVYGCRIYGNHRSATNYVMLSTIDKSQLPLFVYRPDLISNKVKYWLRDVSTGNQFCYVRDDGAANSNLASLVYSLRPAFAIYKGV